MMKVSEERRSPNGHVAGLKLATPRTMQDVMTAAVPNPEAAEYNDQFLKTTNGAKVQEMEH
jgi:hypothetical protein